MITKNKNIKKGLIKMIFKTLSLYDFMQEFENYNRDYFSYEGYEELYNLLNEVYPEGYELDVIGIVCDFTEYFDKEELEKEYNMNIGEIKDNTLVIELENGSYVIQVF